LSALLEVDDVYAGYGQGGDILQGVTLRIEQGDYLCIIGPNGAGKSTLLRLITGVLTPRRGRVLFEGRDIGGRRPDLIFRDGIVTVPQGRNTFPDMTVWENMLMGAYSLTDHALINERIAKVVQMLPVVAEKRNIRAGLLSGGQQKQVEIGRAMLVKPKLLILDEPTMGLEPRIAKVVLERVELLRSEGTTILLVEQNARLGLGAAQDGCVMELGRIKLRGRGVKLLEDPEVGRLYLGEEAGAHQIRQRVKPAQAAESAEPAEEAEGSNSPP
jgi:branched-chain amino acid transport system ATP-binding protein